MFPHAPQAGIAETVKRMVNHPAFAPAFFNHYFSDQPEARGRMDTADGAEALRALVLAMIDRAAGAPGAERRLNHLSREKQDAGGALAAADSARWVAGLMAAFAEIAPELPDQEQARIRRIYLAEAERFIESGASREATE